MPAVNVDERATGYKCLICPERDEGSTWQTAEGLAATHQRTTGHPVEVRAVRVVRLGISPSAMLMPSA